MTGGASLFPSLLREQFVFDGRLKCQSDYVVVTLARTLCRHLGVKNDDFDYGRRGLHRLAHLRRVD